MLQHLYLLGFMGSGKSTVGPLLATRLKKPFQDLDELIEQDQRMTVREIFAQRGEAHFRKIESELLLLSAQLPASVIALGGGTFCYAANREVILNTGLAIWLRISLDLARERCETKTTRPLARNPEQFQALFNERQRSYSLAHLTVDVDGKTVEQIVDEVVLGIGNRTR